MKFNEEVDKLPKVSVIMNCYNCSKYLKQAIDSVYAQTYKDWEIIFWDNASTDQSASIANSYDERLRYFRGEETVLLGHARNFALQKARGEVIGFLDCDDYWYPTKLEKQVKLFQNPEVGIVYCNVIFLEENTGEKRVLYKKHPPRGRVFNQLLADYFLDMNAVLLRRRCLESLSEWFDESFNYIEETDLFTRIGYDWELDYVFEPLSVWRIHGENLTWKKISAFGEELRRMLSKYKDLYPNFSILYPREIKKVEARAAYREAQGEWMKDNKSGVRSIVGPWITTDPRLAVIYLLSFMSFQRFNKLLNFIRRIV
ncbi:MAG: hypothetical protein VR68_09200 [Peptococcaceae bacterium BRH_c4a]|nr:MAG: hypothetical protein VR68_09200 [Peptococcaceae bacterium BRH_c4a]